MLVKKIYEFILHNNYIFFPEAQLMAFILYFARSCMSDRLKHAFDLWISDQDVVQTTFDGITINDVYTMFSKLGIHKSFFDALMVMDMFEKNKNSKFISYVAQAKLERPLCSRAQQRPVKSTAFSDIFHIFDADQWKKASESERLAGLQKVELNYASAISGRYPREVMSMESNQSSGLFMRSRPDIIVISKATVLKDANCFDGYDALDTILHEGRHAYQYDVINGLLPETKMANLWRLNNKTYINAHCRTLYYFCQPVETDAYNFSYRKMKSIAGQLDNPMLMDYLLKMRLKRELFYEMTRSEFGNIAKEEVYLYLSALYHNSLMQPEWLC